MKTINIEGKYNIAKAFVVADESTAIDQHALAQIKMICDDEVSKDAVIRIMPDVHAGKVGPIGLTMKLKHKRIIPNLIGNDIGCGLIVYKIATKHKLTDSDFTKLDKVIKEYVPSGNKVHKSVDVETILKATPKINTPMNFDKVALSMGTLGGGNHFIEVDVDEEGNYYLCVHTGSRSMGAIINDYYNKKGQEVLKAKGIEVPYEMTYIEGDLYDDYEWDCNQAVDFAYLNRQTIAETICKKMGWKIQSEMWDGIHNYLDYNNTLRKGSACDADPIYDYRVYIPINMKDGIIYGTSKYYRNPDWNDSIPHGSGRLIKRSEVKDSVSLTMFKNEMKGIYSSCVRKDTIDESPFAYRRIEEIKEVVSEVIDVEGVLRPVYNFKAGGKE